MFSCRALLLHCSPFGIHSVWLVVFVMLYQLLLKYFVLSASLCVAFFVIRVCRYTACACCLCGASLFSSILDCLLLTLLGLPYWKLGAGSEVG